MRSCSRPRTKPHRVAAPGCQGGWEILCLAGWSCAQPTLLTTEEGEKEVGAQLKFLLRKGWFAPILGNLSKARCPSIKWVGAAGMH